MTNHGPSIDELVADGRLRVQRPDRVTLEGMRLKLEPLVVSDAAEMAAVLAEPALYEFTGGSPPSLEELRERYRLQAAGRSPDGSQEWLNWIVRLSDDGRAIGFVQATIVNGRADIAWLIGVPWQGHGFATEAARALVGWLEARRRRGRHHGPRPSWSSRLGPGCYACGAVTDRGVRKR